ncbi:MAG: T9SS type A sorting domain-containing protein [Lewinellaceae bacterium]|nr:T9SS type A sorting domain-containing protein [Lewinellaceae bacterium]
MPAFRLLISLCLFFISNLLYAQPGTLDANFGKAGVVTTNIYPSDDQAFNAVRRPDGRILIVGSAELDSLDAFAAIQLLPNGDPDPDFDLDGIMIRSLSPQREIAYSVALYPNGNTLIGGTVTYPSHLKDFGLLRILPNGQRDPAFGNNGAVISNFNNGDEFLETVLVRDDGKIIAVGTTVQPQGEADIALACFLENGQPDSSFGINGKVVHSFSPSSDVTFDALLLPDGKILVTGQYYFNPVVSDFLVARFLENGQLDQSFGTNGFQLIDFDALTDLSRGIALQPDGKILLAGFSVFDDFIARISATRLHPDGSIDSTFGINGKVVQEIGQFSSLGTDVQVQADGKILISGMTEDIDHRDFFVLRLLASGAPDSGFATNGVLIQSVSAGDDNSYVILPGPDGAMYLIGKSEKLTEADITVLRILENGTLDPAFQNGGVLQLDLGNSYDDCYAILRRSDETILLGGTALNDPTFLGNLNAALCAYLPDGSPDHTFGNQGIVASDYSPSWEGWIALAQQADQKILAGGLINKRAAIVRFMPNGTPDSTFGQHSQVRLDAAPESTIEAMLIQPDGKILAAGYPGQFQQELLFRRFLPSGSPDSTFGQNGIAPYPFNAQSRVDWERLEFTADGKILASGLWRSFDTLVTGGHFLARLHSDGDLDTSFGDQGYRLFPNSQPGFLNIEAFTQLPDGKILLACTNGDLVVMRLFPNGQTDTAFATQGVSTLDIDQVYNTPTDIQVQPDGRILISGRNSNASGGIAPNAFVVVRLNPDGSPDPTFANQGVFQYPATAAVGLALQPNGNILVAGNIHTGSNRNNFILLQLLAGPTLGVADTNDESSAIRVYPNPVGEVLGLEYELVRPQKVQIHLFDNRGQLIGDLLLGAQRAAGPQTEALHLPANLAGGMYILTLETEGGSRAVRIVKAN